MSQSLPAELAGSNAAVPLICPISEFDEGENNPLRASVTSNRFLW